MIPTIYDILEKAILWRQSKDSGCQGLGGWGSRSRGLELGVGVGVGGVGVRVGGRGGRREGGTGGAQGTLRAVK